MYPRKKISPVYITGGIIILLVLLVLVIGRLDFPGWIMRALSSLVPQGPRQAYTIEEISELRDNLGRYESENALLREQINQLRNELNLSQSAENAAYEILPARVIYRDHARLFATAIIDKGTVDGVRVNMPVVDSSGLVARIVSASGAVSRIELISSPECAFGVIDQRSREIGIVRGSEPVQWSFIPGAKKEESEPGLLVLQYLSPSADISIQDILVTSGLSGISPNGIRVGEVVEIISREEEGRFDVNVRPFADLEHLENVGVVLFTEETQAEILMLLEEEGTVPQEPL